jgi:hypothetical protein
MCNIPELKKMCPLAGGSSCNFIPVWQENITICINEGETLNIVLEV